MSISIAIVKEACYQDLWVGASDEAPEVLAVHTHLRLGPLALLSNWKADFLIVNSNYESKSNAFRTSQVKRATPSFCHQLERREGVPGEHSQTTRVPLDYAQDPNAVNWSRYNVVICLNIAIPYKIRIANPGVTWICMPGEGTLPCSVDGWHYLISHNCPNGPLPQGKIIDMPYTLLDPFFIESKFGTREKRSGIYLEVNSCHPTKRRNWRDSIPGLDALIERTAQDVVYHPNTTQGHIDSLVKSKYFVKLGGRGTRGNSLIEAISAGLVCFLSPTDCFGGVPMPPYCYYESDLELAEKINALEESDSLRLEIVSHQRERLQEVLDLSYRQLVYAAKHSAPLIKPNASFHSNLIRRARNFLAKVMYKAGTRPNVFHYSAPFFES
jgi:hypothetical protein